MWIAHQKKGSCGRQLHFMGVQIPPHAPLQDRMRWLDKVGNCSWLVWKNRSILACMRAIDRNPKWCAPSCIRLFLVLHNPRLWKSGRLTIFRLQPLRHNSRETSGCVQPYIWWWTNLPFQVHKRCVSRNCGNFLLCSERIVFLYFDSSTNFWCNSWLLGLYPTCLLDLL